MKDYLKLRMEIRTATDVEELEKVPLAARGLPTHVFDLLNDVAAAYGDRNAITYIPEGDRIPDSVSWSYQELLGNVIRLANFLDSLGVKAGDPVAMLLPNVPEAHAYLWAAETVGIACPINYMLEPSQISSIISETGSKVIVALGLDEHFGIWEKIPQILESSRDIRRVVCLDTFAQEGSRRELEVLSLPQQDIVVFHDKSCEHSATRLSFKLDHSSSAAAYFHTGGTTGSPKIAVHSHFNQIANAWLQAKCQDLEPGHVRLCGLPLFHVNGAIANGLVLLCAGANLVLCGKLGYRDAGIMRNFWRLAELYRANSLASVPTMLVNLLQIPIGDADISTLKFARCGTAPLSTRLYSDFLKQTGIDLIEGYGLSEGTSISSMNPRYGQKEIGSIGIRFPYQEMKAVRLDGDTIAADCKDGEAGSIVIRGPNVIARYLGETAGKASFLHNGWYDTGDLGYRDTQGYFWLTGRAKDIIIRGGHNIDPGMIEQALTAHPDVAYAAAIGRPDRYTGEMPVAYVTLKPGSTVSSATLLDFVADSIPERSAIPKAIRIIREMPLTAVGKIFKPGLRERATRDGYLEALGGMIAAFNLSVEIDLNRDQPFIQIVATDLSPAYHKLVEVSVAKAFQTFLARYELSFAWSFAPRQAEEVKAT